MFEVGAILSFARKSNLILHFLVSTAARVFGRVMAPVVASFRLSFFCNRFTRLFYDFDSSPKRDSVLDSLSSV